MYHGSACRKQILKRIDYAGYPQYLFPLIFIGNKLKDEGADLVCQAFVERGLSSLAFLDMRRIQFCPQ